MTRPHDDLLHELGAALKRWRLSRRDDDHERVARLITEYVDLTTPPDPDLKETDR